MKSTFYSQKFGRTTQLLGVNCLVLFSPLLARAFANPIDFDDFPAVTTAIAQFILDIALPAAIIMILYAGILYMISGGNEQKVKTAHQALLWGLIGLAVVLIGKGLVLVVCDVLGGGNACK